MVNCGDNKKFANLLIKNLKSNFIDVYQNGKFVSENKDKVIGDVIRKNYYTIVDEFRGKFFNNENGINIKKNISKNKLEQIKERYDYFEKELYEHEDDYVYENTKYKGFHDFNKEKISLLLYNNRDKIMNHHINLENKNVIIDEEEEKNNDDCKIPDDFQPFFKLPKKKEKKEPQKNINDNKKIYVKNGVKYYK
jgi:hypothetical protein